ncbi:MAG: L-threonylcarbamoyladenylate synthase [Pseudomonadota bacterium]
MMGEDNMRIDAQINKAVALLRAGELVAFPTETVYGLGADASNVKALEKIFAAKGRPADHPLIVHIADVGQISDWATDVPATALALAEAFWPGPLTLILKKAEAVADLITGGQDTVGLRMPNHPVARALLREFGGGVAAPSANRFGRISPTTAAAVVEELGTAVNLVLEGGQCAVGVESTIVDVSGSAPVLLRPGMISVAALEAVLKQPVRLENLSQTRVSGSHAMHYAPQTPSKLVAGVAAVGDITTPCALVFYSSISKEVPGMQYVKMSANAEQYAHDLYQVLRELDKKNLSQILIEAVPESGEWDAVRDRLSRACG